MATKAFQIMIDLDTRCSGQWIVAGHGLGKTNLLTHMIGEDLQHGHSIIVMDSKGQLTAAFRDLNLGERLIVIDPEEVTFAINPFDTTRSDNVISQLGYMLGGLLETNITSKQRTFFDTLVSALLYFPNPTLPLLWDIISQRSEDLQRSD
ncbi:hypothetical protein ACVWZV_002244 [Bradyrhizobium sp. GM5.1]